MTHDLCPICLGLAYLADENGREEQCFGCAGSRFYRRRRDAPSSKQVNAAYSAAIRAAETFKKRGKKK